MDDCPYPPEQALERAILAESIIVTRVPRLMSVLPGIRAAGVI